MSNGIMIVKRDGTKENLNIDKIHFVVEEACKNLAGVSSSQIEMNANLQFYDGMTTEEIQEILIRSANDLISLENGPRTGTLPSTVPLIIALLYFE